MSGRCVSTCGNWSRTGLTESQGRQGHLITEQGLAELRAAHVVDGVGFLSAKIDQMTFNMSFDLATRTGSVVVNVSLVDPRRLAACAEQVCEVFAKGYAMGNRVALLAPGETVGKVTVPPDRVGFCTICSITLNGVLLKHGIPTTSRFGGLLELRAGCATRFVEIIYYDGTTIDPLEVFIRSGMTDYLGAVRTGNGLIGASFRELPADSREVVLNLSNRLTAVGLGGLLEVGLPGQAVLGQAVHHGRLGAVIVGGLNPIAILQEMDHRVESRALAGQLDYHRLFPFEELPRPSSRDEGGRIGEAAGQGADDNARCRRQTIGVQCRVAECNITGRTGCCDPSGTRRWPRGAASFADRPHHQGLAAAAVSGGEHAGHVRRELAVRRTVVACARRTPHPTRSRPPVPARGSPARGTPSRLARHSRSPGFRETARGPAGLVQSTRTVLTPATWPRPSSRNSLVRTAYFRGSSPNLSRHSSWE